MTQRRRKPPGIAELEALIGASFVVAGDDIDRAIKVMSSGAPRPPRSRAPDEFEQFLAAAIDFYRYQQEAAAVAGDELEEEEFWRAWLVLCTGPAAGELLPAWARRANRADNVRFLVDHIREQRRAWLAGVPRIKNFLDEKDRQ